MLRQLLLVAFVTTVAQSLRAQVPSFLRAEGFISPVTDTTGFRRLRLRQLTDDRTDESGKRSRLIFRFDTLGRCIEYASSQDSTYATIIPIHFTELGAAPGDRFLADYKVGLFEFRDSFENGRLVQHSEAYADTTRYNYDADGRLTGSYTTHKWFMEGNSGFAHYRFAVRYNEKGHALESWNYRLETDTALCISHIVYHYRRGLLVQEQELVPVYRNVAPAKVNYTYDRNGRVLRRVVEKDREERYTYYANGLPATYFFTYLPRGRYSETHRLRYDYF